MRAISELIPQDAAPLMNAAGTTKTPDQFEQLVRLPIAAAMVGSFTVEERAGNPGTVYFATELGSLNSLGLPGPGMDVWRGWIPKMRQQAHDNDKTLWVSVAGFNPAEYRLLVEVALDAGADVVEVNLGCPNVWESGLQKPIVSYSAHQVQKVIDELSSVVSPDAVVGLKLSPILDLVVMETVDEVIAGSGWVSFVTTSNTVPNCLALSDEGVPGIGFGRGLAGMGGAGVKWIAQGQILQHRELLGGIDIVGVGGITTGRDLSEFLSPLVGAKLCQAATAFWQRGLRAYTEIIQEFVELQSRDS